MDPGHLIAIQVTLLYTLLGPLVLLAIYVLFDRLSGPGEAEDAQKPNAAENNDPALWADNDITTHLQHF